MKLYTIESYYEKEAPFQIAWQVKLFDGHALLGKYEHIFYNEVAGYCKCIEDMGFVKNIRNDIQKELNKHCKDYGKITMTDKEISDFVRMCMEPMIGDFSKNLFDSINF